MPLSLDRPRLLEACGRETTLAILGCWRGASPLPLREKPEFEDLCCCCCCWFVCLLLERELTIANSLSSRAAVLKTSPVSPSREGLPVEKAGRREAQVCTLLGTLKESHARTNASLLAMSVDKKAPVVKSVQNPKVFCTLFQRASNTVSSWWGSRETSRRVLSSQSNVERVLMDLLIRASGSDRRAIGTPGSALGRRYDCSSDDGRADCADKGNVEAPWKRTLKVFANLAAFTWVDASLGSDSGLHSGSASAVNKA